MKTNCWKYHHSTHVHQKPQSFEVLFLRYRVKQTEFSVILDHFLPFYPLTTQTIKILKKWKEHLEMSPFYTCIPKIPIICVIPQKWIVTDMFCSFWIIFSPFTHYWHQKSKFEKNVKRTWRYYPFTHVYQKWRSYDLWFVRSETRQNFLSFWDIFYPFTKDMAHDELFFILGYFLPFYPPNSPQDQNLKKLKKRALEISSFYTCVLNIMIRWCMAPEIWCATDGQTYR